MRAWISSRSKGVTNVCLEPATDVLADLVAPVLDLPDLLCRLVGAVVGAEHRLELACAIEDVGGVRDEEVEEALLARDEAKRWQTRTSARLARF